MEKYISPLKGIGAPLNIMVEKLFYVSTNKENQFVEDDGYLRNRYNKAIAFKGVILEKNLEKFDVDKSGENTSGFGNLYVRKSDIKCRGITVKTGDIIITTRKVEWLINEIRDYGSLVICLCKRRFESAHEIMEIVDYE